MGSIDNIVSITITKDSASVSRAGFGTPMILSCEAKALSAFAAPTYAKTYTTVSDMITDGFDDDGVAVAMATAIWGQNPKPPSIVVGKRVSLPTDVKTLGVNTAALSSTAYKIKINGVEFAYTSDGSATVQEIVEGLAALVNGGTEPVTASEDNVTLTLTADSAGVPFTLEVENRVLLNRLDTTTDAGIVADLTAIINATSLDFYALLLDTMGKAEIEALAVYAETLLKIFIATTGDYDVLTNSTTDIASALQASAYERTAVIFLTNPHERADAAWAGKCLPFDPGSETWKLKTLAGVPFDTLTPTERAYAVAKSANVYERVAGRNITSEGTAASGAFIDETRFIDFIQSRCKEDVFTALANNAKVPFTDKGTAVIENAVRGVMQLGIDNGGFAADPAPVVTVPKVADVSDADKSARTLRNVRFSATLAGAIHKTVLQGTVSV